MLRGAASLAMIAGSCAVLLALTHLLTGGRIEQNVRERELRLITELTGAIPPASSTWSGAVWNVCNGTVLVRTQAAGYGGPVALLVSLTVEPQQHRLRGLRITNHQETPGLADFLEQPDSGWLNELGGHNQIEIGAVDGVTGATITSKAVLIAVLRAFSELRDQAVGGCDP